MTPSCKTIRGGLTLAAVTAALALTVRSAEAGSFEEGMGKLAKQVSKYLETKNEDSVAVGKFKDLDGTEVGTAVQKVLIKQLKAQKVAVDEESMTARGKVQCVARGEKVKVCISLVMVDRTGDVCHEILMRFDIDDTQEITEALAAK
ncbi:MAG: hypothetical protein ACREJB_08605 [Planctomycetaceae bacterium]